MAQCEQVMDKKAMLEAVPAAAGALKKLEASRGTVPGRSTPRRSVSAAAAGQSSASASASLRSILQRRRQQEGKSTRVVPAKRKPFSVRLANPSIASGLPAKKVAEAPTVNVYAVMCTKVSTKKRKSYVDAVLVLDGKYAILKDMEGTASYGVGARTSRVLMHNGACLATWFVHQASNSQSRPLASRHCATESRWAWGDGTLRYGQCVHFNLCPPHVCCALQVENPIDTAEYTSGRVFLTQMAPTAAATISNAASCSKRFAKPRGKSGGRAAQKTPNLSRTTTSARVVRGMGMCSFAFAVLTVHLHPVRARVCLPSQRGRHDANAEGAVVLAQASEFPGEGVV